jgi:hypothetical protein
MMRARTTVMVRLCLVCLALLLLTQDVYSRKISGAVVQEEQSHGHGTATTVSIHFSLKLSGAILQ